MKNSQAREWRTRLHEIIFEADTPAGKAFPTYVSIFIPGSQSLIVIRTLRLLRTFRVFKLCAYLSDAKIIMTALRASSKKISIFLSAVLTIVIIIGSLMYVRCRR